MAFDRVRAGEVDVEFNAQTGQFNADVDKARRAYHEATDRMSDDAIRAAVAQDKLNRAIARYGPESNQAKEAGLRYRAALRQVEDASRRADGALDANARSLDKVSREARTADREMRGLRGGFSGLRGAVLGATAAIGTVGFVTAARSALEAASNLNEQTAKTEDVFGSAAAGVEEFAKNALGLSNDQALELTSTLGALLRPIGLVGEESAKVSETLVKRGVDLASFYNRDVTDAINAVRSGILGEAEPLRTFGVRLSEARVQAVALAQSGKQSTKELTDQEKVLARVSIILKDSSIAAGNYAKTIDGVANQEREAASNARDLEAAIGQGLTPAYRKALGVANDWLSNEENVERVTKAVEEGMDLAGEAAHGVYEAFKLIRDVTGPVIDAMGGLDNAAKTFLVLGALAKLRSFIGGFALLRAASATTRTKVVADMAAMNAAAAAGAPRGGIGFGLISTIATVGAGFALQNASQELVANRAKFDALSPADQVTALRELGRDNASRFLGMSGPEYDRIIAAADAAFNAAGGVNFGLPLPAGTPTTPGAPRGVFDGAKPVTPGSTTPVGGSPTDTDFNLELARATTDSARLALLLRRREFLERTVARFQRKGFGKAELKFRGELDAVKGDIQSIYAARAATAAAARAAREATEQANKADAEARKAEADARKEAAKQERLSQRYGRVELAKTKAAGTATLRDDIAAAVLELNLVRDLKRAAKRGSSEWLALAAEETRVEQAKKDLEEQREKNQKAALDRDRQRANRAQAQRVREAAKRLGIVYGGPGAGGPVLEGDGKPAAKGLGLREFQELRASFFSEFSSDIFTRGDSGLAPGSTPLTQHLHFHAEKDMLAAAREARDAVAHAWSGA